MRPLIIGIAGGTGSGKTTLVENLKEQFGADISVLPHDNYYAAHHDMSLEERQALNYDHPAAFDTDRMIQDLEDLKAGKTVQCPVYDYAIHDRTEATLTLAPNKVILVEGILIFENKALRDLMDIISWIRTQTCAFCAAFYGTSRSAAGRWSPSWSSISRRSSPCTSSLWSRPSATRMSSSRRAAKISSPS